MVLKRLLIILGAYVCTVSFMVAVEVTFDLINSNTVSIDWNDWFITAAILVGTQTLFVLPFVRPPKTALYGKSLTLSFIFAALIASLCTTALVACMYSIVVTMHTQQEDQSQEVVTDQGHVMEPGEPLQWDGHHVGT